MSKPKCIHAQIWPLSKKEQKAVLKGPKGASCKAADLIDTAMRCVNCAIDVGAKSWDILPIEGPSGRCLVWVKFYDRKDFGLCTFEPDDLFGASALKYINGELRSQRLRRDYNKPKMYWWYKISAPHWLDLEAGEYDPTMGHNYTPELSA